MIRPLVMIAIAGFVLCLASFAAAVAIGGPDAVARGGWMFASGDHDGWDWDHHDSDWDRDWSTNAGPQITRTLAWSGAERLDLDLTADVRYVQAAGPRRSPSPAPSAPSATSSCAATASATTAAAAASAMRG
jgi:hypothetical protein